MYMVLLQLYAAPAVEDTESAPAPNPKAASVGNTNGTKTKGGWFEGTTWG